MPTTLREYLEQRRQHYSFLCTDFPSSSHTYWLFRGNANMCNALLNGLSDDTLAMPVEIKEATYGSKDM